MLLKGKLGPILRAIKAVVGAVLQGRGGDSLAPSLLPNLR